MNLIECIMRNSTCYKGTGVGTPVGVLWHDTGAGNSNIKRYVQPHENDVNYNSLINKIGKNTYGNDWNHIYVEAGVNAWIGKLADGSIATVQTLPWNYRPWGCGRGSKGSCNGTNGGKFWLQFECCDEGYKDKNYFEKVYKEACEFTAYLCKKFNIDPNGTVQYNGVTVPTILCHADSYKLGLGSNHGDVLQWFNKFGKTMDDVRNDVSKLMNIPVKTQNEEPKSQDKATITNKEEFKVGDMVRLSADATYADGKNIPAWVKNTNLYVRSIRSNGDIVVSTLKEGAVTGVVKAEDLVAQGEQSGYLVKVKVSALNIRKDADIKSAIVGCIRDFGTYTIVEEKNGWGKLKSGKGWIFLQYTRKV